MLPKFFRTSLFVPAALLAAVSGFSQSTATVSVPVTYSTKFTSTDPQVVSADFSMQLTGDSLMWYSGLDVASSPRVMLLEVGRRYELVLTGYGDFQEYEYPWGSYYDTIPFDFTVSATTSGTYKVYVQNIAGGMLGSGYGYASVAITVGDCPDCCADCGPGKNYGLEADETRVEWSVEMGRGANGELIDPIRFAANAITLPSFSRNELNFTATGTDVTRVPVQGTLQQVRTPAALLNAVDITNGFELRFYKLDQVGSQVGGVWQLLAGATPYVTYRFRSDDGSNPTPGVVSFTRIGSSGQEINNMVRDPASGRWSVVDPALGTRVVVVVSPNVERVEWRDAAQSVIRKVTRTYATTIGTQRELVAEVDGMGRTRTWFYLTDPAYPGSAGKLNLTKDERGGWQNIAYYNLAGWSSVGQIHRIYRPYKDTPDGTDQSLATLEGSSHWSEFIYANDINGIGKLLASRVDKVGSTVVGKETATHNNSTSANYRPVLTSTYLKHVDSNPANAVTTIRQEYAEGWWIDPLYHGKPYAVVAPDRTQVSWVQQRGTWNGSAFTANTTGTAWREVEISGSADTQPGAALLSSYLSQTIRPIYVMAGNSTLTIRIHDGGNLVREELHICSAGSAFEWVGTIDREYSVTGEVKKETRADPATAQTVILYDSSWTNGRKDWDRDSSGVKRSYQYDAIGRVWKVTTEGVSGMTNGQQYSSTTTYTYDAAGQVSQIELKGGLNGSLVSKRKYDLGGYLIESEEPGVPEGRKTTYAYQLQASGRWMVTTTLPGGATRIEQYFRDGRVESITGTAEVAQSFNHWINAPGGGESNSRSPFVQHWATDWAGRKTLVGDYLPSSDNSFEKWTTLSYNNKNQLTAAAQTGSPTIRFGYNPLLGWTEQAVDVNSNGQIDYAGMDPIRTADVQFVKTAGHWWRVETAGAFATDNSSAHSEIAVVETRLSGYSGTQLSQVRTKDATGAATLRTTTFDWALKKLETTVDYPTTTLNETITARNGQVEKVTTAQALLFNVTYDEFGREIARQDPRKGFSEIEFVSGSNDVWRMRNEADKAAGYWTATYTYDAAGRVETETKLLGVAGYGMVTRYDYNSRGELTHRWGNGATPVHFEYNARGQRWKMHTYRLGSGWNDPTWPTATAGTADTTEWVYAPNSGVLTEKRDAGYPTDNNRKVSYTYHPDGQVNVRTWARGVTTTHAYNAARQLYSKTYNDGTPTVTFTQYNRRGQLVGVSDTLTGARTFGYDSIGFIQSETMPASYFGANRAVQWQRDGYGRRTQVAFYSGGVAQFTHGYGYDGATGRLSNMTTASPGNNNGTSRVTSYEYHTSSNEWRWMRNTWASHDVERTLESNRDAVSLFVQKTGYYKAIEATYTRDALGRLATSKRDNTNELSWEPNPLFRGYLSQEELKTDTNYTYTERDELTKEDLKAKVNGVWQSVDAMNKNRMSTFTYDNAENRETATVLGALDNPTPTALNQPDKRFGANVYHDLDGNMTGDGTWTYAYDGENRLKSCSKAGLAISYAYDFMGRRVEMRSDFGTWNFTKRFIWDGWNLIADIWGPDWGLGIVCTYVWGLDVSGTVGGAGGVGGLALMYYNGRAFIPLQDGRGNIHGYLDTTTGKNAVSWDFTAYGETIHERGGLSGVYGTQDFLFRYQSKMQDMSGHLLYFGHRFYHPGMGRFPSRDPIEEDGGLNLYAYVGNSPINRSDVLGLAQVCVRLEQFNTTATGGKYDPETGKMTAYILTGSWYRTLFCYEVPDTVRVPGGGPTNGPGSPDVSNKPGSPDAPNNTDMKEEWRPTKANCDALRNEYPKYFTSPDTPSDDLIAVIVAGAANTAAATRLKTHEHNTYFYKTAEAQFAYTQPLPVLGSPIGGRPQGGIPEGATRIGSLHGHNIGLDTYRWFYRRATEEQYIEASQVFSIADQVPKPLGTAAMIYTAVDTIRVFSPRTEVQSRTKSQPGHLLPGSPSSETLGRIRQCLQRNF
jgi:RHS repeat-associated protein